MPPVDGCVGDAAAHHVERLRDRVVRRRACADDRERGPAQRVLDADLARRRVRHQAHDRQRMQARVVLAVEAPRRFVVGVLAADAGADHDGRVLAEAVAREVDAGLRDRLARRDERKLRDAVEQDQLLLVEVRQRIEIAHFGGDAEAQRFARQRGDRRDRGASFARLFQVAGAVRPSGVTAPMPVMTTRCMSFCVRDRASAHAGGVACCSATSFSTVSTRPLTDSVSKFGSRSGIVILK